MKIYRTAKGQKALQQANEARTWPRGPQSLSKEELRKQLAEAVRNTSALQKSKASA